MQTSSGVIYIDYNLVAGYLKKSSSESCSDSGDLEEEKNIEKPKNNAICSCK